MPRSTLHRERVNAVDLCLGGCLNSCVQCVTYFHDKYTDWRWDMDQEPNYTEVCLTQPSTTPADPSKKSIHAAIIDRNVTQVVRILTARPDAATETNSARETALHLACKLGYLEIMSALLEHKCKCICTQIGSPIHCALQAVQSGYSRRERVVEAIKLMVASGCDINAVDRGRKTALFLTAEQGNRVCMKTLLDLGCNVNLEDINQFSPLYMSVIRGDLDCVNLLLSCLPDKKSVDQVDIAGRTPLVAALLSIINNLKYEKMPNDIYSLNNTPSGVEMNCYNRIAVVEALLEAGADPNAQDSRDRSAIMIAFIILELDNIHHLTKSRSSTTDVQTTSTLHADNFKELYQGLSTEALVKESVYTPLVRLLILSGARGLLLGCS